MLRTLTEKRRTWLLTVICALVLGLSQASGAALAQDGDASTSGAPAPAAAVANPTDDGASATDVEQVAGAVAETVQQAPANIAIAVSVLSPGDSGPVTQTNVAGAVADAVNVATGETSAAAGDAVAGAGQTASAIAQATQIAPANIYIPVSILSPGDHGAVTQTNVATAQALATNVSQTAAGTSAGQAAGAAGAATQLTPQNVAAPVTIGGSQVDHPTSEPWKWSWVWELDCNSAAPPSIAAIGPLIAQLTGGAWDWDWTWTCSPGGVGNAPAPAAEAGSGTEPGTSHGGVSGAEPGAVSDSRSATAQAPRQAGAPTTTLAPGSASPSSSTRHRRAHTHANAETGTGGLAFAASTTTTTAGLPLIAGLTTLSAVGAADGTTPRPSPRRDGRPAAPRAPERPPAAPPGPAPTLFAAGASGGSGPGPLSVGFAALIGAFCLSVPRLGTRARTQLVHRSPQAVPGRKRRPG